MILLKNIDLENYKYFFHEEVEIINIEKNEILMNERKKENFFYTLKSKEDFFSSTISYAEKERENSNFPELESFFDYYEIVLNYNGKLKEIKNKDVLMENLKKSQFKLLQKYSDDAIELYQNIRELKKLFNSKNLLEFLLSTRGVFTLIFPEIYNLNLNEEINIKNIYCDILDEMPLPIIKTFKLVENTKEYTLLSFFSKIDNSLISDINLTIQLKEFLDIPREQKLDFSFKSKGFIKINNFDNSIIESCEEKEAIFNEIKKTVNIDLGFMA